jgi:hypothetical protein
MTLQSYILHLRLIPILIFDIICLLILLVNENFELLMYVHEAMDQLFLLNIDSIRRARLAHNVRRSRCLSCSRSPMFDIIHYTLVKNSFISR